MSFHGFYFDDEQMIHWLLSPIIMIILNIVSVEKMVQQLHYFSVTTCYLARKAGDE